MNAHQPQGATGAAALAQFEVIRRLHTPTLLCVLLLVFGSLLWRSLHTVRRWRARRRQRHALLHLDDRLLRDIGLIRKQQEQEARKPFWMALPPARLMPGASPWPGPRRLHRAGARINRT